MNEEFKMGVFCIPTLTIAGSDSGGGAGLQADIRTMAALGCMPSSVVTAVTAQNTRGVESVSVVAPEMITAQLRAVMDDIRPLYVKTGMLPTAGAIHGVAAVLREYAFRQLVTDPILFSSSGTALMTPDAVQVFLDELLPLVTLLTPNIPEASALTGVRIRSEQDCTEAAHLLMRRGVRAVLIKGGHSVFDEGCTDRLYAGLSDEMDVFTAPRVSTRNSHGTGCVLSSAITAFLARGESVREAVAHAKAFLTEALRNGSEVVYGNGKGPCMIPTITR